LNPALLFDLKRKRTQKLIDIRTPSPSGVSEPLLKTVESEETVEKSRIDKAIERLYPKNEFDRFASHDSDSDCSLSDASFKKKLAKAIDRKQRRNQLLIRDKF